MIGPPLQDVKYYHPSLRVEPRLHENLRNNVHTENEITLEVFTICCQLEYLCKRRFTKKKGGINENHKMEYENKFKPHALVEFRKMNDQLQYLRHPQPSLKDFMRKKGLDSLFPKVWSYFIYPEKPDFHNQNSPISGYFDRLSSLNQLKIMSQQINFDLRNIVNHKYLAHQTALLYHAIADLGSPLNKYKQEVEELFSDVKKGLIVENGQVPHLPMDEKVKLDTLTSSLMNMVNRFDDNLIEPLDPILTFLQRNI